MHIGPTIKVVFTLNKVYSDTQPISKLSVRNGGFLRRIIHTNENARINFLCVHLASLLLFFKFQRGRPLSLPLLFHSILSLSLSLPLFHSFSFYSKISANVIVRNHFSVTGGFHYLTLFFPMFLLLMLRCMYILF